MPVEVPAWLMGLCGFLGDLACGIPRGAVIGGKGAGCDWAPCFFHRQMKCDRRARCSRQAAEMGLAAGHNAGISGFVGIGGSGGGGGGVVAALFEAGSRRCGAVRTRWRSGSWRARSRRVALIAAQARIASFCSYPPFLRPPSVWLMALGTWPQSTRPHAPLTGANRTPAVRIGTVDREMAISAALLMY